jgi:hypothetical protein
MSSLVDGFTRGFDMMDRYYDNQETKRRNDQLMGLRMRQEDRASELHDSQMKTQGLNLELLQNQVDDMPAQRDYQNTLRSQGVELGKLNNQTAQLNFENARKSSKWTEQDRKKQQAFEKLNFYTASGNWADFLKDDSFKGTNVELLQNMEGAKNAVALSESISSNDIPGIVANSNNLFKAKLNRNTGNMKGRDGGVVRDISIIGFEQQEDGSVKLPVKVTTDNGVYNSYISELRGIDPKDPDKQFTAQELFGTAAVMGNLAKIIQSSGVYDQINSAAGKALGVKPAAGNVPAKVQEMDYIRRLLGDEQYKQLVMYGKGKSPQEIQMTSYKLATDTLKDEFFDSPEQKQQAINDLASKFVGALSQTATQNPGGLRVQDGTAQRQSASSQYGQILQQAQQAINGGKDRNAVIQRLIEMGVPQDQINL